MKNLRNVVWVAIVAMSMAACSRLHDLGTSSSDMPNAKSTAMGEVSIAQDVAEGLREGETVLGQPRHVIYTADIRIQVEDFAKAAARIKSIVEAAGGFIANSTVDQSNEERRSGSIDVRVPKARFNDILEELKGLGKVKSESLHGQDVTEEYTDLDARLSNAKKLETRILDLLQRESKSLKDILDVERELAEVRERIEQMEGRKRFFDDRLTLATISIALFEPHAYTSSVFDPLTDAFARAGAVLMMSLAALVTVVAVTLPWVVIVGTVGFFGLRWIRRWWKKKRGYSA